MENRYFKYKFRMGFILISIAVASLAVRLLVDYRFHESALLYVGIPFAIALMLIMVRSPAENISWKVRYLNRLIDSFIIMLGSSVVLFEGFVCVVMFMPIYLTIILMVFIYDFAKHRASDKGHNSLNLNILPFLIVLSSLEGTNPELSFDRHEQVSVSRIVHVSVAEIKHNLQQPMDLQKSRPWFLHLFPMPYAIKAGSLSAGDVHEIHFRYHRWFFTNIHEGHMLLEISEVETDRVKTQFLNDTSYLSKYLRLKSTEILLREIDSHQTYVTLRVDFERILDPYWYFSPIERYGVRKTAEFLISEVIVREQN